MGAPATKGLGPDVPEVLGVVIGASWEGECDRLLVQTGRRAGTHRRLTSCWHPARDAPRSRLRRAAGVGCTGPLVPLGPLQQRLYGEHRVVDPRVQVAERREPARDR